MKSLKRKEKISKMPKTQFILRCPKCRHTMKYQPMGKTAVAVLGSRTKQCVYCGKTFKAKDNVVGKV